ncbi:MAG: methylated-DNA--[protein]-cysteine S-methyltransferase [Patescibacteria group bacterium]|nr:methylated-DNA--[protein]-cysteine S-methyltransferase [Patescibacteria group bacterium]
MLFCYNSPLGLMKGERDEDYLIGLRFATQELSTSSLLQNCFDDEEEFEEVITEQLNLYFLGKLKSFSLKFKLNGTEFQKDVWAAVSSIPYGETRSYSEIANMIKKPLAVRAVASAIAQNKIAIVIPCHRVIRSDGEIGEYAWGSEIKKGLLVMERSNK